MCEVLLETSAFDFRLEEAHIQITRVSQNICKYEQKCPVCFSVTETVSLNRRQWFRHLQGMDKNRISKRVLYMNLETRLRGRPRNRWQNEVREDGRIVGVEVWQEEVYNREEWKKLLRTARNHCILHMPME
jgi:hypothetical protein